MDSTVDIELKVINALVVSYFEVIPSEFSRHCSFTAEVSRNVLVHFGVESSLLPCQVWCFTHDQNYVNGFVGNHPSQNRWDGHVVCSTENYCIDAALQNFSAGFGIELPKVVALAKFKLPTQSIGGARLSDGIRLWWQYPPAGADLQLPTSPQKLVDEQSEALIKHLEKKLLQ